MLGLVVGVSVGACDGALDDDGADNVKVDEIETVDREFAQPAHTVTGLFPEPGMINEACVLARLTAPVQLPPENDAPLVWKTYSPEVDDNETVSVSPNT